jgi:hypothetical protein
MILLKIVSVDVGVIMYGELETVGVKMVLAYFKVCCVYIMGHIAWAPIQNSHSSFDLFILSTDIATYTWLSEMFQIYEIRISDFRLVESVVL